MKYKFEKTAEDTYKLTYKEKEFTIKSSVKVIKELQGLISKARVNMINDLAKNGNSIKTLTIEVKENGKTYYDNSNVKELEKVYQEEATVNYFNDKSVQLFGMELQELLNDIELVTADEVQEFTTQLVSCLSGKDLIPTK
jgi:hypothetical protein